MNMVFLDRDGVIIVEPEDEIVDSCTKIQLFPDTIEALTYLAENDFAVVIITNQAGIASGRITEEAFWEIHNKMLEQISITGIRVLKTYMNGESAGSQSEWRKPGPRMLLKASEDLNLELSNIYMIGDRITDLEAGINAGCKGGVLIGNTLAPEPLAHYTAPDLISAVRFVVSNR